MLRKKPTGKGLAAIYRQELIEDVSQFTSRSVVNFYDKLFRVLEFELPHAYTGRKGFPKEAMLCAFIVMKCESFSQITDLADYLDNNRVIAHFCGFDITQPLLSYWTYGRFLKRVETGDLKAVMAGSVKKLYELGIVDGSFIGLDSTPVMANTAQNNPKSFKKNKFSKENPLSGDPDCALGVHTASNQHNEKNYEFYWGYKSHVLVDCISGLPLYELTTPANVVDSTVVERILKDASQTLSLEECTFLADKGYDVRAIYNLIRNVYHGDAVIPLNKRGTKDPKLLSSGNPVCEAGLAMNKDGKTSDGHGGLRQKFCCPFRRSKTGCCPCDHKNWNNGKRIAAVPNIARFPQTTECLLTENAFVLSASMLSEPSVSDIIPDSKRPARNASGSEMGIAPKTLSRWLILPPLRLLIPPLSLDNLTPTAA